MITWTLQYGGTEKALSAWGITVDFSVVFASKEKSTLSFTTTEIFDAATPQFAYDGAVILRRDRSGSGTSWSAGAIFFQGFISAIGRSGTGAAQNIRYQAYNAWWLAERCTFKQTRKVFAGFTSHNPLLPPILVDQICPEIYLGEKPDETYQTNGQQVTEIINWLNRVYNPTWRTLSSPTDVSQNILQIGTIDPALQCPKTRVQSIFCSEAIVNVLRWSPDCVVYFDYTTTPPTINVRQLSSLSTVSLTITAQQEKQIQVAPQNDRQLNGVILYYKWTNTIDGLISPQIAVDKYPVGITEYDPDVSSHIIPLAGGVLTHVSATVQTEPISNLTGAVMSGQIAWWQDHDETLNDLNIDSATISVTTPVITDETGSLVDLVAYPNVLINQKNLPGWVPATAINAVVTTTVKFKKCQDPGHAIQTAYISREIRHKLTLTNALNTTYTAVSHAETGETPIGYDMGSGTFTSSLAQQIYNAVSTLQYAGQITFVDQSLRSDLAVGKKLTLIGPNNTYTNLLIQRVTTRPHYGETTVEFSPSARLDAPDLIELARATRFRNAYDMPSGRSDGTGSGSQGVDQSASAPRDNTMHGVGEYQYNAAVYTQVAPTVGVTPSGQITQVAHDAQAEGLIVKRVRNDGSAVPGAASITLALPGLGGRAATWQEITFCDSGGNIKKMLVAGTAPYDP